MMKNAYGKLPGGLSVRREFLGATALGLVMILSATAQAQTAPPADNGAVEEITVTASRVERSGYTAPTPTVVIGADQIEKQGATNLAQILDQLPSVKSDTSAQTNGVRSVTPGSNYVDLRGLSAIRTLVLIDGTRVVPQVATGVDSYQVDLNQVPTLMIERTDVVTGGASAQWGSDAIAGVVNVVLKKDFVGFQADIEAGESSAGDDRDRRLGVLAGTSFADGRGHFEAALDYEHNSGVGDVFTRSWGQPGYQLVANPSPATNGLPTNLILPNVQFSTLTAGGIITNTILKGTQFLPGGVPAPFQYGSYVGSSNMVGGGQPGININTGSSIEPSLNRLNLYSRTAYDLTDTIIAHLETSFSSSEGKNTSLPARDTSPVTISVNNAYLPAATKALMVANNLASFTMGRVDFDLGQAQGDVRNYTGRAVLGFNGTFGDDWKWDAHYEYGQNHYGQHILNDRIRSNYALAVNAVVNPANGQIVCASTLTNPTNGCVPLNLFGSGSPSQAAIKYVTGTLTSTTDYIQNAAAFNVNGEPFSTWAGPVSVAAGIEYRFERMKTNTDSIAAAAGYETGNSEPLSGRFNVAEGYFETVVPLLKDLSWAKEFDLNGAVRVSDYSTAVGTQPTWKVGASYTPVTGLLFRGTRSQDVRAPNLFELYSGATTTNQTITYGTGQPNVFVATGGNTGLQAETAQTSTGGVTYQPPFIPGLQTSLDYYDIDIAQAIIAPGGQQVANLCLAGQQAYCSLITFVGGVPTQVKAIYQNLASVEINGFDIAASYHRPVSSFLSEVPGNVDLSFAGNYVLHSYVNTGTGATIDRAGEVGPSNAYSFPHFNMTSSIGYSLHGASITAQVRYVGSGHYDNLYNTPGNPTINNNYIPSVAYLNMFASDQITDNVQVYGVVYNLLNKNPPIDPNSLGYPTNPTYYDMIGTTFRIGVRVTY